MRTPSPARMLRRQRGGDAMKLLAMALVILAAACGNASNAPRCVPGATEVCACDDGSAGAQTCGTDGTWTPCRRAGGVCSAAVATPDGGAVIGDGGGSGTATSVGGLTVRDAAGGVIGTLLDVTRSNTWRVYHHGEGVTFGVNPLLGFVGNDQGTSLWFADEACEGAVFAHETPTAHTAGADLCRTVPSAGLPGLYVVGNASSLVSGWEPILERGTKVFITNGVYGLPLVRSTLRVFAGTSRLGCAGLGTDGGAVQICAQSAIERPDFPLSFPAPLTVGP